MEKKRLMELAGIQLNEAYAETAYNEAVREIARQLVYMAQEDANSQDPQDRGGVETLFDEYLGDAVQDIKEAAAHVMKK